MGVYYHGDEPVSVALYESGPYIYTRKPDAPYLCRQCDAVLDVPYKRRPHLSSPSHSVANDDSASTGLLDLVLPIPQVTPICHNCYLRIPSSARPQFVKDDLLVHHLNQVLVVCPNHDQGCTSVTQRAALQMHLATECSFQDVPCIFAKLGCSVLVQRRELKGHEEMCPLAARLEKTVPYTLRALESLTAAAHATERRTRELDSWMDEVDDVLKTLALDRDLLDAFHARLFEKTLVVPVALAPGRSVVPRFVDMRQSIVDLTGSVIPTAGLLDVLETLAWNRCVRVAKLLLAVDDVAPVWAAVLRVVQTNTTLDQLVLVVAPDTRINDQMHLEPLLALAASQSARNTRAPPLKLDLLWIANDTPARDAVAYVTARANPAQITAQCGVEPSSGASYVSTVSSTSVDVYRTAERRASFGSGLGGTDRRASVGSGAPSAADTLKLPAPDGSLGRPGALENVEVGRIASTSSSSSAGV
ncbi:hypothetical protein AMAG_06565 [Allomyces macrogynus ATCC 38327]|uniref:TRAF-type domain-containing protein n=1 Tax=Allomyces macrogynus (strain ATCC 38327) TaxID=578462 RepID=A0A0L0SHB3_ALLM3|nr:hypothetical protein AMAG_06565 [Allomyces macrogynus ATCC 38327]|eukprot:KNE61765.1 hypothetical protein AMAG_06565 [Allomyces macrogynus ATCC 38327]